MSIRVPGHIALWTLVEQLQLEGWNVAAVAGWYDLPHEAVDAAIRYYRAHQAEIDRRIARHCAFFATR